MGESIMEQVGAIIAPVITEQGLELVDVEYVKEGAHWYLRIYIDKEGGVDIDDCTNVSHLVSEVLDKHDPIAQAYMLEVSSPGLERPLKKDEDFERFTGKLVRVLTKEIYQGYKEFTGYLVGLIEDDIVLEYEKEKMAIPRAIVDKANLTFEF
ncbi:ribosome maturation factor RimP [Desulfitobacterium chlororespirans]|uniref:Ribosome maturation factor RimP n=1 Tax=Desulfitobacterium chlororespirans DSM 11544 TaxID=1121395 RepID=A0A1M7TMA8_9FIRM|nr:ribosome maturation factor RimP [Desulfitobacterium chlororespirans]SHN71763.1 ribosome maturation factor RimP [Desulfitobacterium chlororespirans DSM 11544]